MIKAGSDDADQLTTNVDCCQVQPLVVALVPLLSASFHLSCIVGSQGQVLQTTMSGHQSGGDEVVKGQTVKGSESTPQTLHSLVNSFSQWVDPLRIVMSGLSILDIVSCLESLEALCVGVVDILGKGNKLRRRRSVGSRHFVWRTGQWCRTQRLMLLLAAHVRHGLIWSSLPLPQDPSVH